MSLKDAPAPHYEGRVGLRRRLTGRSRLFLGKCISRYKRKDGCTTDKAPNSPKGRSKTFTQSYNCSVQEETTEPPGSTPDCLASFKESTRLENSSESWCHSLKQHRASDSKHSKMQERSRLNGWRKFLCHVLLCPRHLRLKTAVGDEDQSHDFTFCNRRTRDSFDMALRPSVIYQVIEHKEVQQIRAVETERMRHGLKTEQSFMRRFFCLQDKQSFTKPSHKGLDPAFVVQEDTRKCPCLNLRIQLNCGWVRQRGKKPSPFFQERIGTGQEYIHEETIVLSNRHTDEGVHSTCHSVCGDDDVPRTETLEVSVDVMTVTSRCELQPCMLDASHAETCRKPNAHLGQNDSECAGLPLEEKMCTGIGRTDEPESPHDIGSCQEREDEGEGEAVTEVAENRVIVDAPENLIKRTSSVAAEVTQEDQAIMKECKSTVDEDGNTLTPPYSIPANNSDSVSSFRSESGQSAEEMNIVDKTMSCPDGFIGKNGLSSPQSEEPELGDDVSLPDLCVQTTDLQPPEMAIYQTARLLVQAAMEAALRQLEKDLMN